MSDTGTGERRALFGARIERLSADACRALARWCSGEAAALPASPKAEWLADLKYALWEGTDTLVWAIRAGENEGWLRANGCSLVAADALRPPRAERLLALRLWGPQNDLLVWRDPDAPAALQGRRLTEEPGAATLEPRQRRPLDLAASFRPPHSKPDDDPGGTEEPIRGTRFVRRREGNGRVTITPEGEAVTMRGYVEEDAETGIVRLAVVRFTDVR